MIKGRSYAQIGERWLDSENVNFWPPRRCSFSFLILFDSMPFGLATPVVAHNISSDRLGVEYHALIDNGAGRLWAVDWGMYIDSAPDNGCIHWAEITDNPSGQFVRQESLPVPTPGNRDIWLSVFSWLPMPSVIHQDARWGLFLQCAPAAEQYF
jgi:hypothetical protein